MRKRTRFLVGMWLAVALCSPALSQAPRPGNISAEQYEVQEARGHRVTMRDGVQLSVDVFRPKAAGRFASILSITPYSNDIPWAVKEAREYAARGYAVALADIRGRFDSDGAWDPFNPAHKTDGYDLVEWLAKQEWSNSRVGMIGGSFVGWTQWFTASTAPPSLKAIAPYMAPPDPMRNLPYQEGLLKSALIDWSAMMSGRVVQTLHGDMRGFGDYGGFAVNRYEAVWHTPYLDINKNRGMLGAPWFEKIIRNNLSSTAYLGDIGYQSPEGYAKITVPALNITGWFDEDQPGAPSNYIGMKKYGATPTARSSKLIIGPWIHGGPTRKIGRFDYGPDAIIDTGAYTVRWFDHYLKGIDNGVDREPPVYVYVMGANQWYAEKDWPLSQTKWTKYYFQSGGRANTLLGDGQLGTAAPTASGFDRYVYDPARPTQSPWATAFIQDGAVDARVPETGEEVLVYTTPPLTEDVEVTGPIQAKLFASTSARDVDWIVHLIDVQPDGYAAILAQGVMRARNRDPANAGAFNSAKLSEIKPEQIYEYTVDFWRTTGNLFKKGHRIRVDIQSSYYPYYLRNFNTGADNNGLVREADAVVATQTIHHSPQYPSHILLPVIPKRAALAN